jgi:hypothetical protein
MLSKLGRHWRGVVRHRQSRPSVIWAILPAFLGRRTIQQNIALAPFGGRHRLAGSGSQGQDEVQTFLFIQSSRSSKCVVPPATRRGHQIPTAHRIRTAPPRWGLSLQRLRKPGHHVRKPPVHMPPREVTSFADACALCQMSCRRSHLRRRTRLHGLIPPYHATQPPDGSDTRLRFARMAGHTDPL